jgi:hypothetical protein
MARYTVLQAAAAIRAARGLALRATIETGQGSGLLLSTRDSQPHVLGFGAVDLFGESIALGLSEEEAIRLRDALTEWLGV